MTPPSTAHKGSLSSGMMYDETKGLSPIWSRFLSSSHNDFTYNVTAAASVKIMVLYTHFTVKAHTYTVLVHSHASIHAHQNTHVQVIPTVIVTVLGLMEATVTLTPYIEADFKYEASKSSVEMYQGYDAWVKGTLGLSLYGYHIGPQQELTNTKVASDRELVWSS